MHRTRYHEPKVVTEFGYAMRLVDNASNEVLRPVRIADHLRELWMREYHLWGGQDNPELKLL